MPISMRRIRKGAAYSRHSLAALWGYRSYHPLARGVVTPRNDRNILLFVTQSKQPSAPAYADLLDGKTLRWEGPSDHFAEARILASSWARHPIHLFYRSRHHSDFFYMGVVSLRKYEHRDKRPSLFEFVLE